MYNRKLRLPRHFNGVEGVKDISHDRYFVPIRTRFHLLLLQAMGVIGIFVLSTLIAITIAANSW